MGASGYGRASSKMGPREGEQAAPGPQGLGEAGVQATGAARLPLTCFPPGLHRWPQSLPSALPVVSLIWRRRDLKLLASGSERPPGHGGKVFAYLLGHC